nr:MAG TPA: hypothetical protein [Caudoviricetes sp.]
MLLVQTSKKQRRKLPIVKQLQKLPVSFLALQKVRIRQQILKKDLLQVL